MEKHKSKMVSTENQLVDNLIEQIVQLRTDAKYTQSDVAKATGLTQAQISNLENGVIHPGIDTVAKIAKFYNKKIELV